jgi:membrane protease YdiL (CAAX protease family)
LQAAGTRVLAAFLFQRGDALVRSSLNLQNPPWRIILPARIRRRMTWGRGMFFQKAREGRNAWWRWLVTIFGTVLMWLLGQIPVIVFITQQSLKLGLPEDTFLSGGFPDGVDRNLFLILLLLPSVAGFLALRLLIRWLHRKPLTSVMTGRDRFAWGRAFFAFAVWMVVSGGSAFLLLPAESYSLQFDLRLFLPLLAIALLLVPIQTTFEEVLFRGYLMQGVGLATGSKLVALIVTTLLFVVLHLSNPEFGSATYTTGFLAYLSLSLLFGLATVLDDGIEIAAGLHAANNLFLVLILSPTDGSFTTYSIFTSKLSALLQFSPGLDIALAVLAFAIFFVAFRWRLATLFEPVGPPSDQPGSSITMPS